MIKEFRESRGGFGGGRDRGRGGGFGGRGGFGGGRSFGGGRRDGPREMFDVTCTQCGKECQVPFKPTGSKPVLCSDCFSNSGNSRSSSNSSSESFGQLSQINAKLDKILQVLQDLELVMDDEAQDAELEDEMSVESELVVDSDNFAQDEEEKY